MNGATTLSPATQVNQDSTFCEWNGPAPVPPPIGARMTSGTRAPQRQNVLATLLTIWLKPQLMKSPNCISTSGTWPSSARPSAQPIAPDSMIGVLRTRALPNSATKPSVTLNDAAVLGDVLSQQQHALVAAHRDAQRRR